MAVFNTRSNIGVKFFTNQTRAVTVQRQVAKCIQFIEQRILPANYARVVHHFCKAGNLRMVPPGEHLFKGKTGTVNIAAFQGGYARADLQVLVLPCLFGTAGKPGETGFAHHVDDFMRVANNGRQAARQGSGFKGDRRHHAGFNMQVSINKPWHRRCAVGINPLQSRSISVFCANTGNVTPFNHNWAGNFSAIDQVENRDIINNIIGNSVATGNG